MTKRIEKLLYGSRRDGWAGQMRDSSYKGINGIGRDFRGDTGERVKKLKN